VAALPSSVLDPQWVQIAALLATRQDTHPLGCHRPCIPDRIVFDKLIQVLVFGCGYRRIADHTCSATTLRRRRDERIALGLPNGCAWRCWPPTTASSALSLPTWPWMAASPGPCGGEVAGRSPVDRGKQGLKRSVVSEAGGIPLGAVPAAANRRDDGLLAATLDTVTVPGVLPARPVVHLDAGYDYQTCRAVLTERDLLGQITIRGVRHRFRRAAAGRSSGPVPGATSTASCAGAPSAAGWWSSSGWHWPTPPSCLVDWCVAPGSPTAGNAAHGGGHNADWRGPQSS
jgi:hypothetical protein